LARTVTDPDLEVVGEAGDRTEAIEAAARLASDVILMDIRMPGLDGVAATAAICAAGPTRSPMTARRSNRSQQVLGVAKYRCSWL